MNNRLQSFHVSRLARNRYQFDEAFFNYLGKALIGDFQTARRFASQINQRRQISSFPDQIMQPSQVNAAALIQGVMQYMFRLYCQQHPQTLPYALSHLHEQFGPDWDRTLQRFLDEFPPQPVYHQDLEISQFLQAAEEGRSNQEIALEELVMLWLENSNPAYTAFLDLFGDDDLKRQSAYKQITDELKSVFEGVGKREPGGEVFPSGMSIIDILLEPVRASPHSLEGQLRFIAERWGAAVGTFIYRLLTAVDVLKEETRPIPGPGGPGGKGTTPVPYFGVGQAEVEFEAFTPDREWMPNLVMLAKNAYVWLDQLSKQYKREITHLDQIPDEELDQLASWGITGLWLIGLWERSTASQRIKQMTGNPDAVASAYSLYDYQIAARLGGENGLQGLRERAWKRGIRLASDMVPNHVGIDGKWVMEHPDWFLSLNYSPYPGYSFNGANLSPDDHIGIYLEDHYFDRTDAAVVFKRVDHQTGDTRYIYHGNDGTSMPWNDTAQLNYLNPELREAMIQTILHVARQFPIIRFDAAMTLVKKHIQRLWFPEPGSGGAIPSRSEHGMTKAQFDQLMPAEFWREVVDRAAIEAPDTLLLAEAFWLLEGYFVRTLGMHRVYNSAFMNMLRDEENAKYRTVMKNTIEFDPEVLRRYVNFQNNPDEKTAVEQFGKDDKYFGICMLMVTMPGLPMLGHGQIEGYSEKYGMEYYRAYWDETPDQALIQRHEREIFPLCRKRYLFAGVEDFLLYDYYTSGGVDENVFAYSNRAGKECSLVLYNNAYNSTSGWIRVSAAYSVKTGEGDNRRLVQRTLSEGLGLEANDGLYCIFRDHRSNLEYIRNCRALSEQGFYSELGPYQYMVLLDFRVVADSETRRYSELAHYLNGRGVQSIDEAIREIMVEPIRAPFRELVNADLYKRLIEARPEADSALLEEVEQKVKRLVQAIHNFNQPVASKAQSNAALETEEAETVENTSGLPVMETLQTLLQLPTDNMPNTLQSLFTTEEKPELTWGSLFNWLFVNTLGVPEECRGRIDEWLLGRIMSAALRELGVEEGAASQTVTLVKLATYQRELFLGTADEQSVELLETLLQDTDAQQFLNVNFFQGILWFNRENFETLLRWLVWLVQLNADEAVRAARYATVAKLYEAGQNSGYQVEKLQNALVNADGLSGKAHSLEATAKPLEKEKAADEEKER